jgi:nucleosome binding factor SPN SPT16 subunit
LHHHRDDDHAQSSSRSGEADVEFGGATSLLLAAGTRDDERPYSKLSALQLWLLGYECPETVLLFARDGGGGAFVLHVLASKKKLELLGTLAEKPADLGDSDVQLRVVLHERVKKGDNKAAIRAILADCGGVCGTLLSELSLERDAGAFLKEFRGALDEADGLRTAEIADGVACVLAVKDARELQLLEAASVVTCKLFKKHLQQPMEDALENADQRTPTHAEVTRKAEQAFFEPEKLEKLKLPEGANDVTLIDSCYAPYMMSGKAIDLKPSAMSNNEPIEPSVIVCSLGARYQMYCANVTRTYFIDPDDKRQAQYKAVLKVYEASLAKMLPGATLGSVYEYVRAQLADADEVLAAGLLKNVGFGIGLEFRESLLSLKADNKLVFEEHMVLCLRVGVRVSADWSLLLADTVAVGKSGGRFLTDAPRKFGAVSYDLAGSGDDGEQAPAKKAADKSAAARLAAAAGASGNDARRSTRQRKSGADTVTDQAALEERQRHQTSLWEQAKAAAYARITKGDDGKQEQLFKAPYEFTAYADSSRIPSTASKTRIVVDRNANAVLLPVCGWIYPLHVSTIKNVVLKDQYLRLQLITPISVIPKDPGSLKFRDERCAFIKEAAWRVPDESHRSEVFRLIKELRRTFSQAQQKQRTESSLKQQPAIIPSATRALKLTDVYLRPSITRGKTSGTLEAHQNGFRFRSDKGAVVAVIYNNIKHAFFQPSQNELITVIHLHLYDEILINKKKVRDVQFYTEVMEASQALDGGGRFQAYDGVEEERRERVLRAKINKAFESFVEQVGQAHQGEFEFDVPYRDLAFYGAPNKSNVHLFPTQDCLINITESPFFVLSLAEVDFACMERVHFNNKTFDIIVVFKDYAKAPVAIRSVERDAVDQVREWLDSVNIPFLESDLTFNWPSMLKIATKDPDEFFLEQGGWVGWIQPGDSSEEGGGGAGGGGGGGGGGDDDSDSDAGSDEFEPEDDELAKSDESFDSDEEFDDDVDEEDTDDDDDGEGDDEDDEPDSWSELDEIAEREDKKRTRAPDDDPAPKKRK